MDLLTKDRDIHVLPLKFQNTHEEQSIYLLSDVHFDSVKCDRKLFFKHLDMAKEENAVVWVIYTTSCKCASIRAGIIRLSVLS